MLFIQCLNFYFDVLQQTLFLSKTTICHLLLTLLLPSILLNANLGHLWSGGGGGLEVGNPTMVALEPGDCLACKKYFWAEGACLSML